MINLIGNILGLVFSNKYSSAMFSMFLVFYGGLAGPQLPKSFKNLFEKPFFKLLILSLVAYSSVKDFRLSLLLAVSFVLSISMFDNRYISECFADLEKKKRIIQKKK